MYPSTIGYMYLHQSNQKHADGSVLSHLQIAENVWDPQKKALAGSSIPSFVSLISQRILLDILVVR